MSPREVQFVVYRDAEDNQPTQVALPEHEFVTLITEHDETPCAYPCSGKCQHKNGRAWSPGYIPPGRLRRDANVESFDTVAFDFDDLTTDRIGRLYAAFDADRVAIYSTHRHTEEKPRIRVVAFLSRRITRDEFRAVHSAIIRDRGLSGLDDKKSKNLGHLFYFPTCPAGAPRIGIFNDEGEPFDVEKLLASQQKFTQAEKTKPPVEARAAAEGSIDVGSLTAALRRYDPENDHDGQKRAAIRRVLAGEPLADRGARDDTVHRVASTLAFVLPLDTNPDAAMELMRPSIMAIPQYGDDAPGEDSDGWMRKARFSYERSMARRVEEAEATDKYLAAIRKKVRGRAESATPRPAVAEGRESASPRGKTDERTDKSEEDPERWRGLIKFKKAAGGALVPERCGLNVEIVLRNHPEWIGAFRYNVLTNEYEAMHAPLSESERGRDRLLVSIQNWLAREADIILPLNDIDAQLENIAREVMYDPISEYLLGLKWDGVPRLSGWLSAYCGAAASDYVSAVGQKWLLSAVARALDPGCKADNVLVLEGPQGAFKSTVLNILGGEWFAEARSGLAHRDTLELTARSWIIELPELSAMRKSETEAHKAFFSAKEDRFRFAYARRVGGYKRRCVFAGTTNEDDYLYDDTGNRRYWPVACGEFDLPALRRDRDQLWAEAVAVYSAASECPDCQDHLRGRCEAHRWWFEREHTDRVEVETTARLRDEFSEAIRAWWLRKEPGDRPTSITGSEVGVSVLGIPLERVGLHVQAIGRAMKKLGFRKTQPRGSGGSRPRLYVAPQELLTAPKEERKSMFSAPKPSVPPATPKPTSPTPIPKAQA